MYPYNLTVALHGLVTSALQVVINRYKSRTGLMSDEVGQYLQIGKLFVDAEYDAQNF